MEKDRFSPRELSLQSNHRRQPTPSKDMSFEDEDDLPLYPEQTSTADIEPVYVPMPEIDDMPTETDINPSNPDDGEEGI